MQRPLLGALRLTVFGCQLIPAFAHTAPAPPLQRLGLSGCTSHGVKLSTFVRGVVMEGLTITNVRHTGIEVRPVGYTRAPSRSLACCCL